VGTWIGRWILRVLVVLLLAAGSMAGADWAVWRVKLARDSGFATVTVSRFVVAPLKGNKVEYYPDGTGEERCSRSLFGQGGVEACWWMARHRVIYE
jgi:hypothetical protein